MRRCLPLLSALPLAVLVVVTACSGGGDDLGPTATLGTAPTTATTVARPVDPAVIPTDPSEIDEPYVQAVVDALFAVDAETRKIFLETGMFDQRIIDYLAAIYVGDELERQVNASVQSFAKGTDTLLPGALQNDVTRMIQVFPDCVFFAVERSYSQTSTRTSPPRTVYLGIRPKRGGDDAQGLNPTAWMLFTDGFNEDGSQPEDACIVS